MPLHDYLVLVAGLMKKAFAEGRKEEYIRLAGECKKTIDEVVIMYKEF